MKWETIEEVLVILTVALAAIVLGWTVTMMVLM